MPGRMLTHAARRALTRSLPTFSASTTEGKVVYTSTARSMLRTSAFPFNERAASMNQRRDRIAFVTSAIAEAEMARDALTRRYGDVAPACADVIVALGGDGLMLQTLHKFMASSKPIYGMNRGTVGFLMNEYHEDGLKDRLAAAEESVIHPLAMCAIDAHGTIHTGRAINEVSLFRQTNQAAHLRILV